VTGAIREWSRMTGRQIEALDRDRTVVLLSCSPLEVHGPHLPTMADIREADGLLERSAEMLAERHPGIGFVRLPWMWTASDVLPHVGSIKFRPSTVALVLSEIGESLARQGFRHVWVGSFHGGPRHVLALEKGCDDAHRATGIGMISVFSLMVKRLTNGSSDLATLLGGIGGIEKAELKGDSHGGLVETSMLLHLVGEHVDPGFSSLPPRSLEIDLAERGEAPLQKGEKTTLLETLRSFPLRQQYYERETYAGAPAKASAELGRQYLDVLAREATEALSDVYTGKLGYEDCHSPLWPLRHVLLSERVGKAFDRLVSTRPSPV
jgi:creatinine amidohydrolase